MLFTELAREKSSIFWERSFEHPFIQELVSGELAPEVFRYYLLQDRYYLEHFSKLYFLIAEKSDSEEIQAHLRLNAEELKNGEIFVREGFFKELEIGEQEILETSVAPTAYHYVSHMYRQLIDGTVNSAIAGMLPCAWLYHEIGLRLIEVGSPNPLYQKWIETYASEEATVQIVKECDIINRLYQESDEQEQEQMLEAFLISSKMEADFWEMALVLEKW